MWSWNGFVGIVLSYCVLMHAFYAASLCKEEVMVKGEVISDFQHTGRAANLFSALAEANQCLNALAPLTDNLKLATLGGAQGF